jgi:hypothetical protein
MSITLDNRMNWIRNLDRIENISEIYQIESELGSESRINGVLSYRGDSILCGPLTFDKDECGMFKYLLKVRVAPFQVRSSSLQATTRGYVFKEGLIGEIVALLSVALEARFFILSHSFGELRPNALKVKNEFSPLCRLCRIEDDPVIFSDRERNFEKGSEFLYRIASLDQQYHQEIILSFHHYAKALREIGIDEEMIFIRLVSAIEAISHRTKLQKNLDPLARRDFKEVIRVESLTGDQCKEVRKIFETRNAKRRFVSFLSEYSKGFFKGGKWKAPHTRITKDNLPKLSEAIYEARSNYLHRGDPMYLSTRIRGETKWHTDPSVGMIMDNCRLGPKKKLPYPYFFHKLVRHCLLQYVSSVLPQKQVLSTPVKKD